eukprot:352965-Chlamydomonas_euryale.AAC.31
MHSCQPYLADPVATHQCVHRRVQREPHKPHLAFRQRKALEQLRAGEVAGSAAAWPVFPS